MNRNFPSNIAAILMTGSCVGVQTKKCVSICFSNIVDFTAIRGSLEPSTVFHMLNRLFAKLDRLADHHGVQCIDCIDGCYLAAANCSSQQPADHALRLARFATDAVAAARATHIDPDRPELGRVSLRAGLHCGAVCCSVLGAHGGRKFTLVGDAVNVASRMESQGAAGAAQCSAAFAAEAAAEAAAGRGEGLRLAPREGGLQVRGRGPMPMQTFWVGRAPQ